MNKKTLAALIAGIEKWDRNALEKTPDKVGIWEDTCNLCRLFLGRGCDGCPVFAKTGQAHCEESPWKRAARRLHDWKSVYLNGDARDIRNARARFRRAAKAEANFLRSLLPTTGEPR